ncbi:MAG: hypothetical protein FWE96_06380, partial [Coriobacteriia bacterium]|nr:hypothetical protein [Coriobacteriia bacterium]
MKAELGTELHLIDHYQQSLDKAKTLLSRIEASNQQPCFVLAPRRCGQEELLKAFAEIHEQALELTVFEVRENGSCQEVRRLMLTEFLSNKQEREELREKSEELREKSEEGKEKTGGSGVERLA